MSGVWFRGRRVVGGDVPFLHLRDHPAFSKILPSKFFEYVNTDRPILAGVADNTAGFVKQHSQSVEVFASHDSVGMAATLGRLLDGQRFVGRHHMRIEQQSHLVRRVTLANAAPRLHLVSPFRHVAKLRVRRYDPRLRLCSR